MNHFGMNPDKLQKFFETKTKVKNNLCINKKTTRVIRALIVVHVFGHSAHHIVKNPLEMYNGGVIIYGLGDFINDYSVRHEYQSDEAMICIVHKKGNKLTPELIRVKRKFVEQGSSIPIPI